MRLITKFNNVFGFTQTESRLVLFLVLSFFAGSLIAIFGISKRQLDTYDYTALDSEFSSRSELLAYPDSVIQDKPQSQIAEKFSLREKTIDFKSVNINTANKAELITLPGIGEAMAERIIRYREENGPFGSVDGLLSVKGIGKKKLERLSPYCTTGK